MKIGIALAAYQPDPKVFAEQLASIQSQSHQNWICVLSFDTPISKTTSSPLVAPFLKDTRFVWIENSKRLGHKKNFERAIQETLKYNIEAIACSDQDDIWYESKLSKCIELLTRMGKLALVHSDMHILEKGKILPQTAWIIERRGIQNCLPRHFYVRNIVAGCSMMFDAELARLYPTIPEEAEFHDHWYALIASYYGGVGAIYQPLYAYRQHEINEVGVSPFNRVFSVPAGSTVKSIIKKCMNGWTKSFRLATAAKRAGLPLSFFEKITFLKPIDFGLGLAVLAISNCIKDPPLTRACLARCIGKATSYFVRSHSR